MYIRGILYSPQASCGSGVAPMLTLVERRCPLPSTPSMYGFSVAFPLSLARHSEGSALVHAGSVITQSPASRTVLKGISTLQWIKQLRNNESRRHSPASSCTVSSWLQLIRSQLEGKRKNSSFISLIILSGHSK